MFDKGEFRQLIVFVTNIYLFDDIKGFLKSELESRKSRNPGYSLRAFARDLAVSFSRLSELLNKQTGMSFTTADKIAAKLFLSENEKEFLFLLIIAASGRTSPIRKNATQRIKAIRKTKRVRVIKNNFSGLLSKWYYIPLIELLTFCENPLNSKIASALDIGESEVTEAVRHLEIAGYISPTDTGSWKKTDPFLQIESASPEISIRNFHRKIIETGTKALYQPINKRKFLSTVLRLRRGSIADARRDLETFNRDFVTKYATQHSAEAIYGMNLQFFEFADLRSL